MVRKVLRYRFEVRGLTNGYRFAYDTARKAEQAMRRELMRPEVDATDYVKFNYWDGGRKGLLAGEALYLDLKRMEMAYHENNRREFELTRHVSLRQLDPFALIGLRATGSCEISVPEWLYDLDCPGHYMRRIKSVAVTMLSVVGPFTGVHCSLSLLRSSIRKVPIVPAEDAYDRQDPDDRFQDYIGAVQTVVTSSGNNDSGLFELNLHDERYLPFEGAGAISSWRIELPRDLKAFDYDTIADVILHIRYTARQGGEALAKPAVKRVRAVLADARKGRLALLFSLRNDLPSEWARFRADGNRLSFVLRRGDFPYLTQGKPITIELLELFAQKDDGLLRRGVALPAGIDDQLNGESGAFELSLTADAGVLTANADQVFILIRYSLALSS
jgi:hypothetical protein